LQLLYAPGVVAGRVPAYELWPVIGSKGTAVRRLGQPDTGAAGALLAQPALITVPIAFVVMIVVSLRDRSAIDPAAEMLALHAPEGLGVRIADEELELAP
jgi:hypothetical protein